MTTRGFIGLGAVLLLLGYAFGRYAQPARVVERTVTVEADRSAETTLAAVTSSSSSGLARTVATETTWHADGSVTFREEETAAEVREVIREVEVVRTVEVERIVYKDRERTVENAKPQWRVALDLGIADAPHRLPLPGIPPGVPVVAIVGAERRVVGPVWAGAWASSGIGAGLRVSVEF